MAQDSENVVSFPGDGPPAEPARAAQAVALALVVCNAVVELARLAALLVVIGLAGLGLGVLLVLR